MPRTFKVQPAICLLIANIANIPRWYRWSNDTRPSLRQSAMLYNQGERSEFTHKVVLIDCSEGLPAWFCQDGYNARIRRDRDPSDGKTSKHLTAVLMPGSIVRPEKERSNTYLVGSCDMMASVFASVFVSVCFAVPIWSRYVSCTRMEYTCTYNK